MLKTIIYTIIISVALTIGIIGIIATAQKPSVSAYAPILSFQDAVSSSVSISTTTATSVLSGLNANRIYLQLSNDGSSTVYCGAGNSTSSIAVNKGWRLATGEHLTLDNGKYTGQIFCIGVGTSTLSVIEK